MSITNGSIKEWIEELEMAVICDPDEGDAICCLEEVEYIIEKMKKAIKE